MTGSRGSPGKIRLLGLSTADSLELGEFLDDTPVEFEEEPIAEGDFGDLGLVTAAVLLSVPVLRGLVAYLAYRHRGSSFEQVIEIERPDGTRVRTAVKWRDTSTEPLDAAVARELASATGMPLDQISGLGG